MNGENERRMPALNLTQDAALPEAAPDLIPARPAGSGSGPRASDPIRQALSTADYRTATALCARHYGAPLGRLCMAMVGTQAEADELVQETLLGAHDGFASYRGEGSIAAWLFGIARRLCARHLERRQRQETNLRLVRDPEPRAASDELLDRRRQAAAARAALAQVRPSEREALLLRYVAELSYREVGEACGIDEAAARKRVSRALASLRGALVSQE